MQTIIAAVTLHTEPTNVQVRVRLITPDERVEDIILQDHDWTHDWSRSGRPPASLYRELQRRGWDLPHGDRCVYMNQHLGGESNSIGILNVYEIDYDS